MQDPSFYDWGKTIRGISAKCYIETPTDNYRWLKKKNGEKVLQRMWTILKETLLPEEIVWRDVEEVEDATEE